MGDSLFPAGGWSPGGTLHNLISNPIVVQFVHRWWAWAVAAFAIWLAIALYRAKRPSVARLIVATLALQISLGITTLLSGVAIELAVLHQAVAAVLLATFIWAAHILGAKTVPAPR
jgi:cytochrome c oxidase assembly protein subunit 15